MYHYDDVRAGFDVEADVVVVGSGAGGAVAAANLASAGMRTVVLEAGPAVKLEDMALDPPTFLARHYWEGGLRTIGGSAQIPSMQGRMLGGGTVVNSAIMLRLPDWVREEWRDEHGLELMRGTTLDDAYDRIFERCSVTPTPMSVMGRRNELARDALAAMGLEGVPLPRAARDCQGSANCITGCAGGHKQSTDRTFLPAAERDGASIFTHAAVERVLIQNGHAAGVAGHVVDRRGQRVAPFSVRAPRVVVAAGAAQTPVLLQESGITADGAVGGTFFAHIGGGVVGIVDERVDPWEGATQGWGAISPDIRGMKFECLWAPPSLIMVRWGDLGEAFLRAMDEPQRAVVLAVVYRGKMHGTVRSRGGVPKMKLHIPDEEARTTVRGVKLLADGLFAVGARRVYTGIFGARPALDHPSQTAELLDLRVRARDLPMTANHIFGSCPMNGRPDRGAVGLDGAVRGAPGVYVADASLFPTPSAVNPQATIMALADLVSRRLGDLPS